MLGMNHSINDSFKTKFKIMIKRFREGTIKFIQYNIMSNAVCQMNTQRGWSVYDLAVHQQVYWF